MEEKPKIQRTLDQHYDRAYRENPNFFGKGKPDDFILKAATFVKRGGSVIELGAGQGRNAIPLAEQGLNVRAIDISSVGVEMMNQKAKELGLVNFQAEVGDAQNRLDGEPDLVVSAYMLHHLSRKDAEVVLRKIKELTKNEGINALEVFTNQGTFAQPSNLQDRFYPALGEMRKIYDGWEILEYKEETEKLDDTGPNGDATFQVVAKIIARKPKI